jgi:Protein of unknown function (DUF3618)
MSTSSRAGDHAEAGAQAGPKPAASDDVQQLQRKIELTREQLGATVEQLAARADIKGRAQDKATEVSGQVKAKADQARQEAAAKAESVLGQLAGKTATARQKAQSAGEAGKGQFQKQVAPAWEAVPDPVRQAVAKGASTARQRRVPLAAAVGVLVLGYLIVRRWKRR